MGWGLLRVRVEWEDCLKLMKGLNLLSWTFPKGHTEILSFSLRKAIEVKTIDTDSNYAGSLE